MKDLRKNADLIYQEFADAIFNQFKKERYGIGCCASRGITNHINRKSVLDWHNGVYDEIFERIAVMENVCCDNGVRTAIALFGWGDSISSLTGEAALLSAARGKIFYVKGSTITIDYSMNEVPKILWMAELATEPVKTKYAVSTGTTGHIGDQEDLFSTPVMIGIYRVYSTSYLTQQNEAPIQFKVS
jgi:hypothetical protein